MGSQAVVNVEHADRGGAAASLRLASKSSSRHDLAATTTIRRQVATIQVSDQPDWTPSALFGAIERGLSDLHDEPSVEAVVLRGRRLFAFDGMALDRAEGGARAAVRALSACSRPVVAAIDGCAAGVGLELALACDARIGRDGETFGFPGVSCGRLPVLGGARAVPLLIGFPEAVRMLVFGEPVTAREAMRLGLIDALDVGDTERFALARGAPTAARRHLSEAERMAAEVVLLGVAQRVKRERPGEAAPLAVLRTMEAAIGVSEAEASSEAARLDEKLSRREESGALLHATLGASALHAFVGDEARVADLGVRLFWSLLREAIHLVDEGATPAQVDRCLRAYGFSTGSFARDQRSGWDRESPPWHTYSPTMDMMADAGRVDEFGRADWYQPNDRELAAPRSDPAVERLLDASAVSQWLHRKGVPDEVVARRCLYAAINGTATLAETAPDLDARLLDAIWTTRLGFPRWKGGPLFQAALVGHDAVVAELKTMRGKRNTAGAPSPALGSLLQALI